MFATSQSKLYLAEICVAFAVRPLFDHGLRLIMLCWRLDCFYNTLSALVLQRLDVRVLKNRPQLCQLCLTR